MVNQKAQSALQVAEGDEATSQVLQRHVVRSFGTVAVDLLLRYQVRKRVPRLPVRKRQVLSVRLHPLAYTNAASEAAIVTPTPKRRGLDANLFSTSNGCLVTLWRVYETKKMPLISV